MRINPLSLLQLEDRLTPAAILDATFGRQGNLDLRGIIQPATNYDFFRLFDSTDQNIVSVSSDVATLDKNQIYVRRDALNGTPDSSFGQNGVVFIDFKDKYQGYLTAVDKVARFSDESTYILLQFDKNIPPTTFDYLNGRTFLVDSPTSQYGVLKLDSAGQADTSFGLNGLAVIDRANVRGSAIYQSQGMLTVVFSKGIAQLDSSGKLNTSFGTEGIFDQQSIGDASQSMDSTYFLSQSGDAIFKLSPSGQLDPTYGNAGEATFASDLTATSLAVDSSGNAYVGLTGTVSNRSTLLLQKLTPQGAFDSTFGFNGEVIVAMNADHVNNLNEKVSVNANGSATVFYLQATTSGTQADFSRGTPLYGDIYDTELHCRRYLPSGAIDSAYASGSDFIVKSPPPARTTLDVDAVNFQENGSIVARFDDQRYFKIIDDGAPRLPAGTLIAPADFQANSRTVTADVNGDGILDLVVAEGPGGNRFCVVNGRDASFLVAPREVFESTFTGGSFVTTADLSNDRSQEIILTPDQGGGPRVLIMQYLNGALIPLADFFGIPDTTFRGGARVTTGNVTHYPYQGDQPALFVAPGTGGGPRVSAWLLSNPSDPVLFKDFFVFEPEFRGGVSLTTVDFDSDGSDDFAFGAGVGGGPIVRVYANAAFSNPHSSDDSLQPSLLPQNILANFLVNGAVDNRGGVEIGTRIIKGNKHLAVATRALPNTYTNYLNYWDRRINSDTPVQFPDGKEPTRSLDNVATSDIQFCGGIALS